ncbi:MAG: hypothetical protein ACKVHR_20105 [Pirellulales bacterium]
MIKLLVVACLFVCAGLLGVLTFERHSELVVQHESLCENRAAIESDPRAGEDVYDWMYRHNVVVPIRWVYVSWAICVSMLGLSVAIMLGYDFKALVRGAIALRNAG